MSEQIKYEAVFGDQSLFDGAADDVILVIKDDGAPLFYRDKEKYPRGNVRVSSRDFKVSMRRIIKTPVWTKADQEAGRLPDVGVTVIAIEYEEECKVAAINNNAVCVVFDDGEFITLHVSGISPIEKPEERAKCVREEWCNSAAKLLKNLEYSSTLTSIYDAIISGELKMPEVK